MRRLLITILVLLAVVIPVRALNILIIDDSPGDGFRVAKSAEHRGGDVNPLRSVNELEADLIALGHGVSVLPASLADPSSWVYPDMLIWTTGNNPLPLGNPAWRAALRHFVDDGGRLLIEGGDIAYHWVEGDPLFAAHVLHSVAWLDDPTQPLALFESEHPLATTPNALPSNLSLDIQGYTDADALLFSDESLVPFYWFPGAPFGGYMAYDSDPVPTGGQIIYLPFRYSALDPIDRQALLDNAIQWLGTQNLGDASFSGQVQIIGDQNHSGVKVQVQPGGQWELSEHSGQFLIDGLHGNMRYIITASKEGYRTAFAYYDLDEGEEMEDLYFTMNPIVQTTECRSPELEIPDDDFVGIDDTLMISDGGFVELAEVFLDVEHTWIGDLVVTLKSPVGTSCLLHFRSGSNLNEIYGWYPLEISPVQSLNLFADEFTDGPWVLHIADMASADTGRLNEWCLRLTIHDGTDAAEQAAPGIARLLPNWPNPFNPKTTLRFQLERDSRVKLSIYDSSGRVIRNIWANPLPSGEHQMEWDGRDNLGRSLSTGLYILRLEAGGSIHSQKLMLLK